MSKKPLIITGIVLIVVIAAGIFYGYEQHRKSLVSYYQALGESSFSNGELEAAQTNYNLASKYGMNPQLQSDMQKLDRNGRAIQSISTGITNLGNHLSKLATDVNSIVTTWNKLSNEYAGFNKSDTDNFNQYFSSVQTDSTDIQNDISAINTQGQSVSQTDVSKIIQDLESNASQLENNITDETHILTNVQMSIQQSTGYVNLNGQTPQWNTDMNNIDPPQNAISNDASKLKAYMLSASN